MNIGIIVQPWKHVALNSWDTDIRIIQVKANYKPRENPSFFEISLLAVFSLKRTIVEVLFPGRKFRNRSIMSKFVQEWLSWIVSAEAATYCNFTTTIIKRENFDMFVEWNFLVEHVLIWKRARKVCIFINNNWVRLLPPGKCVHCGIWGGLH